MDTLYKRSIGIAALVGALTTSGCGRNTELPQSEDTIRARFERVMNEEKDNVPAFAESIEGKVLSHTWRRRDDNEWQTREVSDEYKAVEEISVQKQDSKIVYAQRPRKSTLNHKVLPKGTPVQMRVYGVDLYAIEKR